jgi:hypothetical protein
MPSCESQSHSPQANTPTVAASVCFPSTQSEYYAHSIISIRCLSLRIRCPSLHGHNPCCHSCCRDSWEVGSCSDTDGLGNSTCGTLRYFLRSADQKMCGIWTMSLSIAFSSRLYSGRSLWIYVQGRVSRISWTSQNGVDEQFSQIHPTSLAQTPPVCLRKASQGMQWKVWKLPFMSQRIR